MTHVYGADVSPARPRSVWNRLLGDQPLNGEPQPTLYMNPTGVVAAAGHPHRVPGLSAVQPGQRHSVRRSAEAAAAVPGSDLDQGQARPPLRRVLRPHRGRADFRRVRERGRVAEHDATPSCRRSTTSCSARFARFQTAINPRASRAARTSRRWRSRASPSFNRYNEFALYANDNWSLANRLTLNLGVRYEYYGPQTEERPEVRLELLLRRLRTSRSTRSTPAEIVRASRTGAALPSNESPIGAAVEAGQEQLRAAPRLRLGRDRRRPDQRARRLRHGVRAELRQRHLQRAVQSAAVPRRLDRCAGGRADACRSSPTTPARSAASPA